MSLSRGNENENEEEENITYPTYLFMLCLITFSMKWQKKKMANNVKKESSPFCYK